MYLTVVRRNGQIDLGDEARAAGFGPGTAVQVVRLSTGHLLIQPADDQPVHDDLSYLIERHGRRALPRPRVDKELQGE